ncbi:MAG: tryptophan-rich sensory protein, partial [Clostridia bacterium]|nr:tryptophan-rich sensory protein [Clostridia bacterium]
ATIANVTTFLVSIGFDGFLFSESTWTIIVLALGTIIASITAVRNKDFPYSLAVIWGYIGILIKHVSVRYFAGQYPEIVTALTVCLIVLAVMGIIALVRQFKRK